MARKLIVQTDPKSIVAEQYRTIRTNINFSLPDQEIKTILMSSAGPSEGKSTTAANLAAVFSQEGKRVVLVDADMRKPTTHYTFKVRNSYGLSSVLTKQCNLEDAIQETSLDGLFLIPSGAIPPNPAELLTSKQMEFVIEKLTNEFDLVVFDSPPILSVTDGQILSNKCNATVLVVDTGVTEKGNIVRAKEALENSKANIIGVVMNNYKLEKDQYYYYYSSEE